MQTTKLSANSLMKDENFLSSLNLPDSLHVILIWKGGEKVSYYAFLKGELLFQGDDFKPSPLHGYDTINTMVDLLGFLTVKEFDTDAEYFANYTPEQIAFRDSFACEELGGYVSDFEDGEYSQQAKEYFTKHFTN